MVSGYRLEFILHAKHSSAESLSSSLEEFGREVVVSECRQEGEADDYAVKMLAEEPALVFDLCAQFGRIRKVKVSELK